MYKPGHYGVSLLVYAPVFAALLVAGYDALALLGGVAMLALATVPDYDQRVPFVKHRGVTHTFAFAWLVGAALGGAALLLPADGQNRVLLAGVGFGVGVLGILAHLAGDVLTPAGIRPLWPFTKKKYTLSLWTADDTLANYGLLAAGAFVTAVAYLLLA
ncbi:metal-dependent hydrolase [Halarchaeum sp. P4]|uniref:metal-dependent hydrolase n=1 Tax=Halarchaeum sp. P4 TaxID=3421639 RepID=UPI003EC0BF42